MEMRPPALCRLRHTECVEPTDHWVYDRESGAASHGGTRRPAGYWYKTDRTGTAQQRLFTEENHDLLHLVNLLRDEVRRWRESGYRGATAVTKDLLRHWAREDRHRRLFLCQREAVETVIYLAEIRTTGKSSSTGFHKFALADADLARLLRGERGVSPGKRRCGGVLRAQRPSRTRDSLRVSGDRSWL